MLLKDQTSPLITTEAHQGTHRTTTTLSITHQMHHDGCKIRLYLWILAALGPPTVDEEEEEALGEEEANTANITTNPPIASKIMLQTRETRQTPVFNADK